MGDAWFGTVADRRHWRTAGRGMQRNLFTGHTGDSRVARSK